MITRSLVYLIIALTFLPVYSFSQLYRNENLLDGFLLNKSPVKVRFDMEEMYMQPVQKNNKFGYVNIKTGDIVVPFRYDSADVFNNFYDGLAAVKQNGKWGYINKYGKEIFPCQYDEPGFFNEDFCVVKKGGLSGYISKTGKEVISCQYDELTVDNKFIWVKKDKKWGLFNLNGNMLSAPRFDEISFFSEGLAWVQIKEEYGFINEEGVMLMSPRYVWAEPFHDGLAMVLKDGRNGFVNKQGEEVIPLVYENAQSFSEGLAAVYTLMEGGVNSWIYINKKGDLVITNIGTGITTAGSFSGGLANIEKGENKAGMIDTNGKEIIPCEYQELGELSDSMIAAKKNGKWGYYNLKGQLVISCRFDEAESFYDGEALVTSGDSYYINKKGVFIRPVKRQTEETIDESKLFTIDYINTRGERIIRGKPGVMSVIYFNGMTPVRVNSKWGFMNKEGILAIPCKYDSVGSFSEGLASVRVNDKWGYIYQDDDTLTSCRFDYAYNFHRGIAIVKTNGKYGYLGKTGEIMIPCRYDMAYTFKDSLAVVRIGDQFGYINKAGEQIIPCHFDDAFDFNEGLAVVKKDGLWGYINKKGLLVISFQFDEANQFSEGLAAVKKDGKLGYIDKNGIKQIPFRYIAGSVFSGGIAMVSDSYESETVVIDASGNEKYTANFRSTFFEDLAVVENAEGKKGYINREGKLVIPYRYDNAEAFNEGLAAVEINKKSGFINKQGILVIPCQFDGAFAFNEGLGIIINMNK